MGIAPYEPDWGTRQNMLEGRAVKRRALLAALRCLLFKISPEKCGNLRPGKGREQIQDLILIAL